MDSSNNLYMSDLLTNTVWKITPGGVISILAGGGSGSCSGTQTDTLGDGCPATDAKLSRPEGLGIDANNNLYIADVLDYVIREVSSATGKISIFAGSSTCGGGLYSTSAGPYTATQANLCNPSWIAVDSEGNSY
jgi:sugar lactone lactonase YvrE